MSDTQTTPEYRPQHVLAAEENEDATQPLPTPQEAPQPAQEAAEGPPEDKSEVDPAEEARRAERRRDAQRIGYLTRTRNAEKLRAEAAEQRLREYEQAIARQSGQPHTPSQEEFQRAVEQAAAQKVAADERNERFRAWEAEGNDKFGSGKFLEACNTVANFAGTDAQRGALVDVLLDSEGGQRALMELAGNAEEAERIMTMPPHRMALAIAKLGSEPAKQPPKPVSNAPPPVRPPTAGRARGEPDPERGDMDSYMRWSAKQNWRR